MPTFENAKTESRAAFGSFRRNLPLGKIGQTDPQWLGYAVAAISRDRVICAAMETGMEITTAELAGSKIANTRKISLNRSK